MTTLSIILSLIAIGGVAFTWVKIVNSEIDREDIADIANAALDRQNRDRLQAERRLDEMQEAIDRLDENRIAESHSKDIARLSHGLRNQYQQIQAIRQSLASMRVTFGPSAPAEQKPQ